MGLDYTSGCVNFRDFGGYVNLIIGKNVLPEGKLFRGGSIDFVYNHSEIEYVQSIINLRSGPDPRRFNADYYHFPASNKLEKYDTANKDVKNWLNRAIQLFEQENLKYPVLIHCLSGKDRTGIVVSALLLILGINITTILQEYLLSEGEADEKLIQKSIEGFMDLNSYFTHINIDKVRSHIL